LETYTIIGVAVVAAVVLVLLFKARTDRFLRAGGGRVTMESQSPQSQSSTSTIAVPASRDPSTQADAIESALAEVPEAARAQAEQVFKGLSASHGFNIRVNANIKTVIRVQTKELADAIAQRERAKGMDVSIIEPTGAAGPDGKVDNLWTVTASKGSA
jgi:hypothetical protein